jgi:arsenate reductase (thioredoxin)
MTLQILFAVLVSVLVSLPVVAQASHVSVPTIVFVCEHGSAKSVVAAAHFNRLAEERGLRFRAVSRGTVPDEAFPPAAMENLARDGLKPADPKPVKLAQADLDNALGVVTFCEIPAEYKPPTGVETWTVPPVSTDYAVSRDAILTEIERLLSRLQSR